MEEEAPGDLPQLLRHLKGKTTPPLPTPIDLTQDAPSPAESPSLAKKIKKEG